MGWNAAQLVEYWPSIHKAQPKWQHDSAILAWQEEMGQKLEDQKFKVIFSYIELSKQAQALKNNHTHRGDLSLGKQTIKLALSDVGRQEQN